MRVPISLYGIVAKVISLVVPIKKNCWIFGSDYGRMYREGSRFLLEYMLDNHPEYRCTFITKTASVKKELDDRMIPCEMNFSFRGMVRIAQAEVVFTTQSTADILFVFRKHSRRYFFLSHGQPYKAVFLATPKRYGDIRFPVDKGISKIKSRFFKFFSKGYEYWESEFFTSTSEFLVQYNKLYYGENSVVNILGMPRNDILFSHIKIEKERWLPDLGNKFIITYMPTHRDYGHGAVSPMLFANNLEIQDWLRKNDVVVLIKQHPNMEFKIDGAIHEDVIIDISKMKLDPQVCLYHSDVLITDYSSVWIDFLILQRPILFYYYDDFENNDTGILYDLREDPPGPFCYSEEDLFHTIIAIKANYDSMRPSDRIVSKYHKYVDGNSCERYFNAIVNGVI